LSPSFRPLSTATIWATLRVIKLVWLLADTGRFHRLIAIPAELALAPVNNNRLVLELAHFSMASNLSMAGPLSPVSYIL